MKFIHLDIVSVEAEIFSGNVESVTVMGMMGEMGIAYGHSPLLTKLKPGNVNFKKENGAQDFIYVSGGILEVQPHTVTILAETALRGEDLDEAQSLMAKQRAEKTLKTKQPSDFDYSLAASELAQALAQLKTINELRKKFKV